MQRYNEMEQKVNLTDISTIRSIFSKHGFNFSKALGQNFLINPSICPQMVKLSGVNAETCVIEIGPGIGVLTAELCKIAKKVVAIELDIKLIPILGETLAEYNNVKIINDDALKIDLSKLIMDEFNGMDVVVCANLPYYITSPVIMRLLESRLAVKGITVMVQKEAAIRLCAAPGRREAGSISYTVNYYSQPEIMFEVSSSSFMPRPKVDSCVIRLNIRDKPPVDTTSEELFFRCIHGAFNQRRKTILNALSASLKLPKEMIILALDNSEIPHQQRGEKLTLQDYAKLSDNIFEMMK
jgi:16S rRNA (adenine1518-N6/adenine1519-N6)-dimethyltransferase